MTKLIRIPKVKKRLVFSGEQMLKFYIGLLWANPVIINFIKAILLRIPYVNYVQEIILFAFFTISLILAIPTLTRSIPKYAYLVYLIVASVYLLNFIFFPQNSDVLAQNIVPFLFGTLTYLFVGLGINIKRDFKMLYNISMVAIVTKFILLVIEPTNISGGDMSSSYQLLPHICLVLCVAIEKPKVLRILVSLLGVVTIFSFGTRGPLICLAILCIISLTFKKHKHPVLTYLLTIGVLALIIIFFDNILDLLKQITSLLGMSTRIFDRIQSETFFLSDGRNIITTSLLGYIKEKPLIGYGFLGDRTLIGFYSHNILIEFCISFGVIVGVLLLIAIAIIFIKKFCLLIKEQDRYSMYFFVTLFCCGFIKLFMSGTFINEKYFFLLIGFSLTSLGRKNYMS